MKKMLAILALGISVGVIGQAIAQNANGGFTENNVPTYKIKTALTLNDDTPVVLFGKIEKALGNEKYQLNDGTGIIVVEIDDDEWNGLTFVPNMNVKISGEIDTELTGAPEVDVESIVLVQ